VNSTHTHAEQIGEAPPVKTDGITQEQADAIGQVLAEEYESNEAFRSTVNARAEALGSTTRGAA
jgi:hypothetical protein